MSRKAPIAPADFNRLTFVSDPQVAPDGRAVAFVVTRPRRDKANKAYTANLWMWRDGRLRQLTHRTGRCASPRWSPNGRHLAFTYGTRRGLRLEVLPAEGGEARTLYAFERKKRVGAFEGLQWHPSGRRLLFLSATKEIREGDSDVRVVRRLFYKLNDVGFFHDRRRHLYALGLRAKRPKELTKGEFDVQAFDVSPDGGRVAFVANTAPDADYTLVRDIHVMAATGGRSRRITKSKGPIFAVRWSPDGKRLAYMGHDLRRGLATNPAVWIVAAKGGKATNLTEALDRPVGNALNSDSRVGSPDPSPVWSAEGDAVHFLATDRGACHLHRVSLDGAAEALTEGDRSVEGYAFSDDRRVLAYAAMTATTLADVILRTDGRERRLTRFNDRLLARLRPKPPEPFAFPASDGERIEGWILRGGRGKGPGILEIHGGPHTTYGHAFMFEFQLLASRGYRVVYTNPRGSRGYGEDFAAGIVGGYGDRDYADLMEAADYVVGRGWVDGKRFGVTGGSYGGFMTNWIVTHTDRFAAAVTQRSISNWQSFYGTSDIGYFFATEEMASLPWDDPERFAEKSPITYVASVTTPLLILHSERDERCPMEQAEQLYVALKHLKREVELVRFPDESHELSRAGQPRHRLERLARILGWFEKHLRGRGRGK
jgi:acylaminoacyl-peptidase